MNVFTQGKQDVLEEEDGRARSSLLFAEKQMNRQYEWRVLGALVVVRATSYYFPHLP